MKTKYTAEYFINKFSKIPDERWITGHFVAGDSCCALGHCGATADRDTIMSNSLTDLFVNNITLRVCPSTINDANTKYQSSSNVAALELGDTPKERILNALTLIAAGVTVD